MASYDIPQWLKDARAWTSATKGNQAVTAFQQAGQPAAVTDIARQISNLYEGMRYGAEDAVDDYDRHTAAQRQAMLDQFAQTEGNTQAAYSNSQNYMSEIAKRLGLEQVLQGPGVESQNQQTNQVLALNNTNKTNQLASYDLLRGGYGGIMRDRLGSYDVQAGTSLANLLTQLQAQAAAAAAAKGGGGGGRGSGGGSSGLPINEAIPSDAQVSYMAVNPTTVGTSRAYALAHPNDAYYTSGKKATPPKGGVPYGVPGQKVINGAWDRGTPASRSSALSRALSFPSRAAGLVAKK